MSRRADRVVALLRGLARLFVFTYQIFFLLGFHRRYLYKTDIEDQNVEDGSKGTASKGAHTVRDWKQVFSDRLPLTEQYVPLLLNGSACYVSMSGGNEMHPILLTLKILSLIMSANASFLSAYLIYSTPALFDPSFHKGSSSTQKQLINRATQVVMLKSIPQAGSFWSWAIFVIYRSSRYAIVDLGLDGRYTRTQLTTDAAVTGNPLWSTIFGFTALLLCTIHFFVVVAWLDALSSQGDDDLGLTTAYNLSASHPQPSSKRTTPSIFGSNEENAPRDSAIANSESQPQDSSSPSEEQYAGMGSSHYHPPERRSRKRKGVLVESIPGPEAIQKTDSTESTASGVSVEPYDT